VLVPSPSISHPPLSLSSNGALRVKNDSEEYEQEEVVEQPEEEEYGWGKRRAVANKRYNEVNFWQH
jgi:hypothetical protein